MRFGISIPDYFKDYLEKIATLNHSNPTKVCSLIVINFLSYNLNQKKFPKFKKFVKIVFENENFESNSSYSCDSDSSCPNGSISEQASSSRAELMEQLNWVPEDPEDSGYPFDFDSED